MQAAVIIVLIGWYWIDPNLGMINDAVRVFCEMGNGESCVFADPGTQKVK